MMMMMMSHPTYSTRTGTGFISEVYVSPVCVQGSLKMEPEMERRKEQHSSNSCLPENSESKKMNSKYVVCVLIRYVTVKLYTA